MAKLLHNIAALLIQKGNGLFIASICMRRSIELREMIKNETEDLISRLGMLCKIMLRLSDPCACVAILLEMISYASILNFAKNRIFHDIVKACGSIAYWCERNSTDLEQVGTFWSISSLSLSFMKKYFGPCLVERLAAHSGPEAVEFALLVLRLVHMESSNRFSKLHSTCSCEKNCVMVLKSRCRACVTQYWLQMELRRLTFYQGWEWVDEPIVLVRVVQTNTIENPYSL